MDDHIMCIKFNFKFYKMTAFWRADSETLVYRVYRIVLVVIYFLLYLGSILIGLLITNTVDQLFSEAMYLSLTEIAMGVKTFYIFINFHTVYRLHQMAISKQFQPTCEDESKPAQKLLSKVNFCFMAYFAWVFITVLTAVPSFFDKAYKLPFFSWILGIPYGADKPYNFYCLWIYQLSGLFLHGIFNVAAELQVGYLLTVARIQLDFLSRRFSRLVRSNGCLYYNPKYRESFIECVQHYTVVDKFVQDFEHVYSKPMFAQFCASGASICATAYRLSSVRIDDFLKGYIYIGNSKNPMLLYRNV